MTTFSTKFYKDTAVARPQSGKHERSFPVAFTAAIQASDVFQVCKLPKGAKLSESGWFLENGGDYDTSTNITLTLRVTDGTTTKTIISASTLAQSAASRVTQDVGNGSGQVGWVGFKTTSDAFRVELLAAAGPTTSTSGTITVGVAYSMDTEAGD